MILGTREQAQVYLAQGSLCRAAVIMQGVVKAEPTNENRELLAEIYMQQGLHEDAMELHAQIIRANRVAASVYVN